MPDSPAIALLTYMDKIDRSAIAWVVAQLSSLTGECKKSLIRRQLEWECR